MAQIVETHMETTGIRDKFKSVKNKIRQKRTNIIVYKKGKV